MIAVGGSTGLPDNYVTRAMRLFAGYGDQDAIVYQDRRISYVDLLGDLHAMVTALRRQEVKPASAIAILAPTQPATIVLQFAAHLLGCRTVWVPGYAPVPELADYLDRAAVDFFVYDPSRYAELAAKLHEHRGAVRMLCIGRGGSDPDLLAGDPEASALGRGDPALGADGHVDVSTSPESLFYTSGTTGSPKLVHHQHRFFDTLVAVGETWLASGGPVLRHLAVTGFTHVSGHIANLMTLFTGGTLVLMQALDIPEFLDTIRREKITSTLLTPVQLYQVLDHPALAQADVSSLSMLSIGGAPAAPARLRQAIERFGPVVRVVYGLSEAAFVTEYRGMTVDPDHPDRLASCGYPFADSRIEIRDETGGACPPGTAGVVWVTGGLVMNGYWGTPELSRQVMVDGWLSTGDIGYLDDDGYLYLVDRSKDMIITGAGAMNVYTRQVEDILAAHPQVRSAAVVGVPDRELGEAVCAFVVRAPGASVTEDELRALVRAELTGEHAPKIVEFVEALPVTGIGKVDKKALRAWHLSRLPAPQAG